MSSFRIVPALTAVVLLGSGAAMAAELPRSVAGLGRSSVFYAKLQAARTQQLAAAKPQVLSVGLGYLKGLSRSFTAASGWLQLDLRSGTFEADLAGLDESQSYSLWLVQQAPLASVGDLSSARLVKLADVDAAATPHVAGTLSAQRVQGFSIDRVVLARGHESPSDIVISGSLSVLQKLMFGRSAAAAPSPLHDLPFAALVPSAGTTVAAAAAVTTAAPPAQSPPADVLIAQGENLFFNETFDGNGRTCGTCHPATRNFTIDPEFIATLPPTDPLFVAEFNPALAQLERPALMRGFGLILENVDGLDDPTHKFVMRGVPHTLGLTVSLTRDSTNPAHPAQMTGWSGDGAPGTGALRDFAVGAVTQHFTRSLNRVAGVDFTLPNNQQLDAMEAFQLSLGRSADYDLAKLTFLDAHVANGQSLFVNGTGNPNAGGRCNACHGNGGAIAANGQNRNFNTNVENVVNPARSVEDFPIDGGFGATPANADGSFGDRTFNTPPVVEAADTAPFFHNNTAATLEDVIAFYNGPVFNGPRAPAAQFSFDAQQAADLAAFLRALNTLQNIQVARNALEELLALNGNPQPQVQSRLQRAASDTGDAMRVLTQGGIFPDTLALVTTAQQQIAQAQQAANPNQQLTLVQQAVSSLNAAQDLLASIAP